MYRIIVADDEAMERKALEKMIQRSFPDIVLLPGAPNGIELINSIKEYRPEIAVIDINMPGFNGLDAMEIISLKQLPAHFIIVSAYSKFEYAQKALSLGAWDYLLKPVSQQRLASSIERLCEQLDLEKQQQQKKNEMELISWNYQMKRENELLSDLLLGDVHTELYEAYLSDLNQPFYEGLILSVRLSKIQRNEENAYFNTFLNQLKKISTSLGKIYKNSLIVCLFPPFSLEEKESRRWLSEILFCAAPQGASELWIGVSSCKYTLSELSDGVRESRLALSQATEPGLYFYQPLKEPVSGLHIHQVISNSLALLESGSVEECEALLRQAYRKAEALGFTANSLGILTADFIYTAVQTFSSEKEMLLFCSNEYSGLFTPPDIDALLSCLHRLLHQFFLQEKTVTLHRYIIRSLSHIRQYYMENLTLEQIGEEIGISSFYLSRLFKQELNSTFLAVLTNIRLAKVLELLRKEQLTVQEISERTGYLNVSYFYKLVKKQTGMTISEIKKLFI